MDNECDRDPAISRSRPLYEGTPIPRPDGATQVLLYYTPLEIAYFQASSGSCRVGTAHHQRGHVARQGSQPFIRKLIGMVGSAHPTITITNSNYRERKRNNTQRKV